MRQIQDEPRTNIVLLEMGDGGNPELASREATQLKKGLLVPQYRQEGPLHGRLRVDVHSLGTKPGSALAAANMQMLALQNVIFVLWAATFRV